LIVDGLLLSATVTDFPSKFECKCQDGVLSWNFRGTTGVIPFPVPSVHPEIRAGAMHHSW